jgi:hypothetical protein
MDEGAIGSIVAGYPLQLMEADDPRLMDTLEFLLGNCMVKGGFFHNIIHSGINAYLTLHIAQVLLRAEDVRALELIQNVANLASPTGQWPEAIHPRTGGGCMGDGQHGWAAAEWVMILRNCFVREERRQLVIGSGINPVWLEKGNRLFIGPVPTEFGELELSFETTGKTVAVNWEGNWRQPPEALQFVVPGFSGAVAEASDGFIKLERTGRTVH